MSTENLSIEPTQAEPCVLSAAKRTDARALLTNKAVAKADKAEINKILWNHYHGVVSTMSDTEIVEALINLAEEG
jgi:hypothetical protein